MNLARAVPLSAALAAALVDAPLAASPLADAAADAQTLIDGLKRTQQVLTLEEYDVISGLLKKPGVRQILYLNKYGEVRWFGDPGTITMSYDQVRALHPVPRLDLVGKAWREKKLARGGPSCAIPLTSRRTVLGILYVDLNDVPARSEAAAIPPDAFDDRKPSDAEAGEPADENEKRSWQYYLDGLIWYFRGNVKRARESWGRSLEIFPGNAESRLGLSRLPEGKP